MPDYDYRCEKCRKKFAITMSIMDHGRKRVKCPKCKSVRVAQTLGSVYVQTSKKS